MIKLHLLNSQTLFMNNPKLAFKKSQTLIRYLNAFKNTIEFVIKYLIFSVFYIGEDNENVPRWKAARKYKTATFARECLTNKHAATVAKRRRTLATNVNIYVCVNTINWCGYFSIERQFFFPSSEIDGRKMWNGRKLWVHRTALPPRIGSLYYIATASHRLCPSTLRYRQGNQIINLLPTSKIFKESASFHKITF